MTLPPRARVPMLVIGLLAGVLAWAWPAGLTPWRAVGVASGWAGTALIVASTALIVREPRLARWLGGVEAMLRGHHVAGTLGYALLLLHPLALALDEALHGGGHGWAVLDPRAQGGAERLGWAALLLLMAGLASTFSVRLRWRRWRAWHHLLAAGVVLGLLHVERLFGDPGIGWLLAATVALALGVRYLVLDRGLTALPFRVADVQHLGTEVVEATLAPLASPLPVQPGQFVLLAFGSGPGFQGCGEFHPFTVSGADARHRLRVAIKALGPCSSHAQQLGAGTTVRLQGPFGGFLLDDRGRPETPMGPQLWVAGGIGITPFIAALRQAVPATPLTLLYLVRAVDGAPFVEELQHLAAAHPTLGLRLQASRDAAVDLPALLDQVPALAQCQVRACGPAPLLQALRRALADRGVPADALRAEQFDFR
jgi:predicted ferric reductase